MAESGQTRIHLVDVGVVVVVLLLAYGVSGPARPGLPEPGVVADVLVTLTALPLMAWRRAPVHVFATVVGVAALYLMMGYAFGPVMFQLVVATGVLTWQRRGGVLLRLGVAYAVVLTGVFTVRCLELSRDPLQMLLHWPASLILWGALPAAAGILLRAREQAEARTRTEQSRRTASEEQLRMAQELHDAVGHGLSVIAMQAGAGRHVLDHDPDRARQALQAVEETARSSLDALRREIAALGAGGSRVLEPSEAVAAPRGVTGARDSVRLRPQEGVADLPLLVERVRDGGLLVELDLDAALDREVLPAEVDHAAYRIVQESLTNVLRHAGTGVTAQVRIRAVTAELLVEVSNTDAGEPDDSAQIPVPGNGLQGMQIRARRVGGRVEVAPHARGGSRGGFCVTARLPLPALARTERR